MSDILNNLHKMNIRQLENWLCNNETHEDYDEVADYLDDCRQEAAYERETFGEPEDSPCLEEPWWKHR